MLPGNAERSFAGTIVPGVKARRLLRRINTLAISGADRLRHP